MKSFNEFLNENKNAINLKELFDTIKIGSGIDINRIDTLISDPEAKTKFFEKVYGAGSKVLHGLGKKFSSVNIYATVHRSFIEFRASSYYAGKYGKTPVEMDLRIGFSFNPKGTILKLDKEVSGSVTVNGRTTDGSDLKIAEYKKMVKEAVARI